MTQPSNRRPTEPLSVGNVVSTALRVYRDHFKTYFLLAFRAFLWILIPIYGWAKYSAISGQISRLVFNEIREQPETPKEAYRHTDPKKWTFLLAGLLVGLIVFFTALVLGFLFAITALIIIGFLLIPLFIFIYIWIYSRLSIVEVPIAIEAQMSVPTAVSRSWDLTKDSVLRLIGIYLIAFLITLPFYIVVNVVITLILIPLAAISPESDPSGILVIISNLLSFIISFASGALFHPFWQAIKAVVYYDLRSRKEGIDLEFPPEAEL